MMDKQVSCAERIVEGLHFRQMSQTELCKLTGIPKSAMSQYCNGAFKPKQDRLYLIATALRVEVPWLMGFDVPMEKEKKPTLSIEGGRSELDERINRLLAGAPEEMKEAIAVLLERSQNS